DGRLGVVCSVEAVLEPEAIPVHGRLEIAAVPHLHSHSGALRDLERRARDGAVVGEHPDGLSADSLRHRGDLQVEMVAVVELHELRPSRFGQAVRLRRELLDDGCVVSAVIVHCSDPLFLPCIYLLPRPLVLELGDLSGNELGVVLDPADQGGAARVLPCQSKEVEAGYLGYPAAVPEPAVGIEDRKMDPGVVRAVSGCPEDCIYLELASILEPDRPSVRVDATRLQLDAVAPTELTGARADECLTRAQPTAKPRLDGRVQESRLRQPPEQIPPEQALRKRRLARADREDDLVRSRELLCDLEARVAAAHDEYRPFGNVRRSPITRCVRLEDLWSEPLGQFRDVRRLERARRHDDLFGGRRPAVDPEHEPPVVCGEAPHARVFLYR